MQPNYSVSPNIEKSWEMIEKARLYLAKNAPQDNRQHISRSSTTVGKSKPTGHIHPQLKKRTTDAEGTSASSNSNRELVRSEDVKAEIQSQVKHSLSAMRKDKNKLDDSTLGSNGYKEVARVSSHTILAAYGLEHHQALAQSFSRPLCNRNKDMSNLVPGWRK